MAQLSQHSLSDFIDCPRRFYLKHVARQAWPQLETGYAGMDALAYREYLRLGLQLHRRIERHWLGIPDVPPADDGGDGELATWWARFTATDFTELPPLRIPELALSAPLAEFGLYARFDLLACGDGRAVVVDWKTMRGARPPAIHKLRERPQTRVYLYVLAAAGAPFNGGVPLAPEQCSMRYWLANFPEQPWVDIPYSTAQFAADSTWLAQLAANIRSRATEADFPLTPRVEACALCNYRTLCAREAAGSGKPEFDDDEDEIDLENVPALDY